jgi:hemoglobin/transferrin/lactoferrin receptor protein
MKNILFAFLFSCLFTPAMSQEKTKDSTSKVQQLDEVVISINKWEQKINEVPNKVVKVNIREARIQNPQTTADLLGMTGSVYIQKSQLGGGSPMIRGFSTNRVLIVVDGVRMNNAIYRSGNLQNVISIDALATENAEIIFGPGSIIYGSDAIGGVMDFKSLQPKYSWDSQLRNKLNAVIRYSSANNERTGHIDFSTGNKILAYSGSITHSDFDDLRMGSYGGDDTYVRTNYVVRHNNKDSVVINNNSKVQRFTGYSQLNVLQKLRFKPAANWDLQYSFHYSGTSDVPRYDRLIELSGSNPSFADWYYGPQLWRMHALQVTHNRKHVLYHSARFVAAYQNYEESRHDRRLNSSRLRNQVEQVKVLSTNLDLKKSINSNNEFFYGLEFITNEVGSFANRVNINTGSVEPAPTRYPNNSAWNSYGLYSSFKSNVNQFTFSSGLRYNYVTVLSPFDTTLFKFPFTQANIRKGAITGNLGMVFRPTSASQLNMNFATGFRVPNVDDLGKVFESAPGQLIVPNPDLNPEYAYNMDIGYAINIRNRINIDITAFYTLLDNAIVRRPSTFNSQDSLMYEGVKSRVFSLQNTARARVYGIQAGIEIFILKHLSWLIQANWVEGTETDDTQDADVPLRHAPPFYANTHLKLSRKKINVDLYALWNGEVSNKELAPSEQAKTFIYAMDKNGKPFSPSWYTVNIKTGYQITEQILLSAGWENITNRRYRPYSSGIVSPGSNVILSLRATL